MSQDLRKKESILRNSGFQTILASLLCILLGLLVGFIVLLVINPGGAAGAIAAILKNFLYYPSGAAAMKYFGTTLVNASALLMCSLSVLFAYKVGLFNIGAAGQYVVGAGACLYCALALKMPWIVCLIVAVIAAALVGGISGALKAYFNVNEVISCIMLNWISLYCVNMLLVGVKEQSTPYTTPLSSGNKSALLPNLGLDKLFTNNEFVTIGLPLAVVMAILVWVVLEKTKFGYELKATGLNKNAAKYCGMKEQRNVILTMMIAGGLAGFAAGIYYLTGIEQWMVQRSRHGLQRHRGGVPGGPEPHRHHLLLLLHPAHHQRRYLRGQEYVLLPDLRSDLCVHHLPVRLRPLLPALVQPLAG